MTDDDGHVEKIDTVGGASVESRERHAIRAKIQDDLRLRPRQVRTVGKKRRG